MPGVGSDSVHWIAVETCKVCSQPNWDPYWAGLGNPSDIGNENEDIEKCKV